jgi:acyl-CoA synthetase (AMP-forming)/AMP-acid ligase II
MSIMRSNCVAFPISPRNSPSAVAHLLKQVGVHHLLVSGDYAMQQLAQTSLEILASGTGPATIPSVSEFPSFGDIYLSSSDILLSEMPCYERRDSTEVVLYIHSSGAFSFSFGETFRVSKMSSGSTSHPKPIPYTNLNNLQSMHIPWYGEVDLTDSIISAHCVPMFHVMGAVQIPSTVCPFELG